MKQPIDIFLPARRQCIGLIGALLCFIAAYLPTKNAMADVHTLILKAVKGRKVSLHNKDGSHITGIVRVVAKRAVIIERENGRMVQIRRKPLARVKVLHKRVASRARREQRKVRDHRDDRSDQKRLQRDRTQRDGRRAQDTHNRRYRRRRDRAARRDRYGRSQRDDRIRRYDRRDRDVRSKRYPRGNRYDRPSTGDDRDNHSRRDDRRQRDDRRSRPQRRDYGIGAPRRGPNLSNQVRLRRQLSSARTMRNAGIALTIIGLTTNAVGLTMAFTAPSVGTVVGGLFVMQPLGGTVWLVGAPLWGVGNAKMARLERKLQNAAPRRAMQLPPAHKRSTLLATH